LSWNNINTAPFTQCSPSLWPIYLISFPSHSHVPEFLSLGSMQLTHSQRWSRPFKWNLDMYEVSEPPGSHVYISLPHRSLGNRSGLLLRVGFLVVGDHSYADGSSATRPYARVTSVARSLMDCQQRSLKFEARDRSYWELCISMVPIPKVWDWWHISRNAAWRSQKTVHPFSHLRLSEAVHSSLLLGTFFMRWIRRRASAFSWLFLGTWERGHALVLTLWCFVAHEDGPISVKDVYEKTVLFEDTFIDSSAALIAHYQLMSKFLKKTFIGFMNSFSLTYSYVSFPSI
jgi:hypothetical protein